MKFLPLCLLTALLAGVTACSDAEPPPPPKAVAAAPQPSQEQLMQAVFGKHYRGKQKDALVDLPDPENREVSSRYLVSPISLRARPGGEALLLTNSVMASDQGEPEFGHADAGLVSLYRLRWQDGVWKVRLSHIHFDGLGSMGNSGEAQWLDLSRGRLGLAMHHGGMWQGNTLTLLALYDLSGNQVKSLTKESIRIASANGGACAPITEMCWDVTAQWRFVAAAQPGDYDDLVLSFSGSEATLAEPVGKAEAVMANGEEVEPKRNVKQVTGSARYRFSDGHYRLVEGTNKVPEI
ncbi:hypothetical protein [Chitinimonas lacunae]|uniref:Lipoprotein n=1 Tax=Chitinimonas lacunae TaxID=1963018 RepID=A0ABV8MNW0_9NEIS